MNFTFSDDVTRLTGLGPTFGENSGLQFANVWGGVRLVRIIAGSSGTLTGLAVGAAALVTTPLDDGAALSVVGVPEGQADYEFIYDGIPNGEADGRFGNLDLDLTPATGIDISVTTVGRRGDSAARRSRPRCRRCLDPGLRWSTVSTRSCSAASAS